MGWPFLIGILTTTAGAMALPLAIFSIFFGVKPEQRPLLSRRAMAAALFFLALFALGCVNLYMVCNIGNEDRGQPVRENQTEDPQEPDGQDGGDGSEQGAGGTGHTIIIPEEDLSPEELLVKQNWDEIQQLKAQYSEADTETFSNESDILRISICETAGYVFQDLMKTEKCDTLRGMNIPNVTVVIMDYSTDQILCTLTSDEESGIFYSPGNEKEFYAAAFHDDYDIYVTHPFKVTHGNGRAWTSICLEKKENRYTPLSRLQLHMLNADRLYTIVPPQYGVTFFMTKNGRSSSYCYGSITESGVLIYKEGTYFSLNTDYTMELYLEQPSEPDPIESMHETFNGSDANSNQTHLYFQFNQDGSDT